MGFPETWKQLDLLNQQALSSRRGHTCIYKVDNEVVRHHQSRSVLHMQKHTCRQIQKLT